MVCVCVCVCVCVLSGTSAYCGMRYWLWRCMLAGWLVKQSSLFSTTLKILLWETVVFSFSLFHFFAFSVYKSFSVVSICVPYFTKTPHFHHISHLSKSMAILQEMLGKFSFGIVISKCSLYLISKLLSVWPVCFFPQSKPVSW
jgi:hypothetical protein